MERFLAIGLDAKLVSQTLKNVAVCEALDAAISLAGLDTGCDKKIGFLVYSLTVKLMKQTDLPQTTRSILLQWITSQQLTSMGQLDAAITFIKKELQRGGEVNEAKLRQECGAGVLVTPQQVVAEVSALLLARERELRAERYRLVPQLLASLRKGKLKWADGRVLKEEFDKAIEGMLGPKTEDSQPAKTPKVAKANSKPDAGSQAVEEEEPDDFGQGRDMATAHNTPAQQAQYEAAIKGKIRTRFPPEPNGFMHIGHAKAIRFNFFKAKELGGTCILRFDDTNPEAEKQLYIDNIIENVTWLIGERPETITYASDYFQELYDLACKLIRKGKAYVCHQTKAEIEESRKTKTPSPYRSRSVQENLRLFEDMRKGKFAEGGAVLRMKGDLNHPNPQMWDLVAYRIKYVAHPHAGHGWCIYPSYDWTHCINDSLEFITYSLCTTEFEARRESYYWLLDELDLYKPKVWEFSRLNLDYGVVSKRFLRRLVTEKWVAGWDDPRLLTLNGMRRRGYTPAAIMAFCESCGVTRNLNNQSPLKLEDKVRRDLDPISLRGLVVAQPLMVKLTNWPEGKVEQLEVPNHPKDPSLGTHQIPFSGILYIEGKDFKMEDSKDYYGLAPGKTVFLKYAYNMKFEGVEHNTDGSIDHLRCQVDVNNRKPAGKGILTWVAQSRPGQDPAVVELRDYELLFLSPEPLKYKEQGLSDWIEDINTKSLIVYDAFADSFVAAAQPGARFQFERNAYYFYDPSSTPSKLVFNRTVKMKEDKIVKNVKNIQSGVNQAKKQSGKVKQAGQDKPTHGK
eukprot:gb/GEZN01002110.1/.p1 GENE.gb/GEZN01002110.1/~~gb/GEZN01002110.1/.p1  ORF type:complete len:794 (-),score=150.13 gb/GEZN01002110.1/:174-2555(-)